MKRFLCLFFFVSAALCQQTQVPSTEYTRDLLRSEDAATARTKLGIVAGSVTASTAANLVTYAGSETNITLLSHTTPDDGGGGQFVKGPASWSLGTVGSIVSGGSRIRLQPQWFVKISGGSGYTNGPATFSATNTIGGTDYVSTVNVTVVAVAGAVSTVSMTSTTGKLFDTATNTLYYLHQAGSGSNATINCRYFKPTVRAVAGGTLVIGAVPAEVHITHVLNGVAFAAKTGTNGNYSAFPGSDVDGYQSLVTLSNTAVSVVSITRSGSTATATVAFGSHKFQNGDYITIAGADQPEYNGLFEINGLNTADGGTTFTYTVSGTPATPATGTITAAFGDLTEPTMNVFIRGRGGLYHDSATTGYWWSRITDLTKVSSKWFGARGDTPNNPIVTDEASYDEWPKLQATLDAASIGRTVAYIPGGNYLFTKPLVLNAFYFQDNIGNPCRILQGSGAELTRLTYAGRNTAGAAAILPNHYTYEYYTTGTVTRVEGTSRIRVADLQLWSVSPEAGNYKTVNVTNRWAIWLGDYLSAPHYVYGARSTDSEFENLQIANFMGETTTNTSGGIRLDYSYGDKLKNVTFTECNIGFEVATDNNNMWYQSDATESPNYYNNLSIKRPSIIRARGPYASYVATCNGLYIEEALLNSATSYGIGKGAMWFSTVKRGVLKGLYCEGAHMYQPWVLQHKSELLISEGLFNTKDVPYSASAPLSFHLGGHIGVAANAGFIATGSETPLTVENSYFNAQTAIAGPTTFSVTSLVKDGTGTNITATCSVSIANTLRPGQLIRVTGASPSAYNGTYVIDTVSGSDFTYWVEAAPASSPATGTITASSPNIPVLLGINWNMAVHWGVPWFTAPSDLSGYPPTILRDNICSFLPYWAIVKVPGVDFPIIVYHRGQEYIIDGSGANPGTVGPGSVSYHHGTGAIATTDYNRVGKATTQFGGRIALSQTNASYTVAAATSIPNFPPLQRLAASTAIDMSANPQISTTDAQVDQILMLTMATNQTGSVRFDDGTGLYLPRGSVFLRDNNSLLWRFDGQRWHLVSQIEPWYLYMPEPVSAATPLMGSGGSAVYAADFNGDATPWVMDESARTGPIPMGSVIETTLVTTANAINTTNTAFFSVPFGSGITSGTDDTILTKAHGSFAATANNKCLQVVVYSAAGTNIVAEIVDQPINNGVWQVDVITTRLSSSSVRTTATIMTSDALAPHTVGGYTSTGLTLASVPVYVLVSGGSATANDVLASGGIGHLWKNR